MSNNESYPKGCSLSTILFAARWHFELTRLSFLKAVDVLSMRSVGARGVSVESAVG